jgi:hypothetical protein
MKTSASPLSLQFVMHRDSNNSIPVDLLIETSSDYSRSMNAAIFGIDANFTYNKGIPNATVSQIDSEFKITAAHEFGHSVLMYSGGIGLSWGHKGSTNALLQNVKSETPGYPAGGDVDLMKYYDIDKARIGFIRRINDTRAMGIDIKRLIWSSVITWKE